MPLFSKTKPPPYDDGPSAGIINMRQFDEEINTYTESLLDYNDFIFPSAINALSPKYLYIDGVYIAVLLCVRYSDSLVSGLFLSDLINSKEGIEVIMYFEHENKAVANKEITHYTGFTNYQMSKGDNQIDSSIQRKQAAHALLMKDRLAEGDELYYINTMIRVSKAQMYLENLTQS